MNKILICGKTGTGKTTLANELSKLLSAAVFDGDVIRNAYPNPLGFGEEDRLRHAEFMGGLCDAVVTAGGNAIASFICPTPATRMFFDCGPRPAFVVWMDRAGDGEHPDSDAMWKDPVHADIRVTQQGTPFFWANKIYEALFPAFQPTRETGLFIGRYQPFHEGHKKLIEAGLKKYPQVCIGVRDTTPAFPFYAVKQRIEFMLNAHWGKFQVIALPNIVSVLHGRDVGWKVEHIDLDEATKAVSATNIRKQLGV
jgi:cytidyltransferase-like protein